MRDKMDDIPYNIFAMKEPGYTMELMSTYGSLVVKGDVKKNVWMVKREKNFQYQEPFSNHFLYQHVVNDHNNHQHSHPQLKKLGCFIGGPFVYLASSWPSLRSTHGSPSVTLFGVQRRW